MTGQYLIFNKSHILPRFGVTLKCIHTPFFSFTLLYTLMLTLPPRLPGVSVRGSYLTSKNMAAADLWLVLITNQMARVVQGGRPPSSLKSHFLFIVLSLGLSVFFIACCRWFYLVPADSTVGSSAGCREADSLGV